MRLDIRETGEWSRSVLVPQGDRGADATSSVKMLPTDIFSPGIRAWISMSVQTIRLCVRTATAEISPVDMNAIAMWASRRHQMGSLAWVSE